ncbi:DUF421 domain-containing protein [Stratiformator vulcanicus]|uniref:DUF421 domain-containing protein n=1 Tax=Stratiformator vulcanicus TaxID=2527980 RepID=A0A517QWE2_9PLAN|nr:YetF domain-containing protein [Stratiformator vulcanicus]QDT35888.1 hypothetical protein Pan189_02410 [Stratiformator vulcanicus]
MMNWFGGWEPLIAVIATAPVVYLAVVAMIRIAGKRTTSQMNNFDWIVTVAMGSLVGSTLILKDVSVVTGLTAICALLFFQWLVTWGLIRSPRLETVIRSKPTLLYYRGEFLKSAQRETRVSQGEILSAVRGSGAQCMEEVAAVVLETDATLSVVAYGDNYCSEDMKGMDILSDIPNIPDDGSPTPDPVNA